MPHDAFTGKSCLSLQDCFGLRHQGATPEAAVDEASASVERWLATR